MEITPLLSTAATVLVLALGVALMVVLAVVPTWLRYDAERADPVARVDHAATPAGPAAPVAAATPSRAADRHALAA
jgi:predicted cobalt transporter CbtA